MAAGEGSKIEFTDYNEIQSIIGPVLGTAGDNPAPTITAGSFVVGILYQITNLGTTTQLQWNTIAGTSGVTYAVSSIFKAATVGVGTGQVREITLNYGQAVTSSPISQAGVLITNTQWGNLRTDILRARQHQTGTDLTGVLTVPYLETPVTSTNSETNILVTTSTSSLSPNLPIRFFGGPVFGGLSSSTTYYVHSVINATEFRISNSYQGAVRSLVTGTGSMIGRFGGTKITEADRAAYKLMAQAAYTDRLITPPVTQHSRETLYNNIYSNPWNGILTHILTVDFTSNNAARHFFNTGGRIELVSERSGGPGGLKNATWTSMLSEISGMGRIIFDYNSTKNILTNGATGAGTASSTIGFYQLSSNDQLIFQRLAPSGAYADNKFRIYVRLEDSPGLPGSRSRLTFTVEWRDESANPNTVIYGTFGPFGVDENVEGNMTSIMELFYATGNNVSIPLPVKGINNNFSITPISQTNTSYAITSTSSTVNEGTAISYSISTVNVPSGTVLYWTNGGNTTAADFTDSVNVGSVTIDSSGTASLVRTVRNDALTDGPENVQIILRTGSTSGPIVASSSSVVVNDTSLTPIIYNISVAPTGTQNEGVVLTYTVTTENFGVGTLYWTNVGTTTAADFTDGLNSGSIPINNNAGTFVRTVRNDSLTETAETVIMALRVTSPTGTTVATAPTITVSDTSTNILPVYTISTNLNSVGGTDVVGESSEEILVYVATNATVPAGLIYYRITGAVTTADLSLTSLNGSVNIVPGAQSTLKLTVRDDGLTEGTETFFLNFYLDAAGNSLLTSANVGGTVTGNSRTIQISDTSRNLVIGPTSLSAGTSGSNYNVNLTSVNGDGFYTYSVIAGFLPPGVSLQNNVLSGLLETAGTYSFTIASRDTSNKSGTRDYTVVVNASELLSGPTQQLNANNSRFSFAVAYGHAFGRFRISTNGGASYGSFISLDADGRYLDFVTQPRGTVTYRFLFESSGNTRDITVTTTKIVCTAMNDAYGFGAFRSRVWLAYAAKNLTPAHEIGYHTMFLPLVNYAYYTGDTTPKRAVRAVLENIARHRGADLRAEMRGSKRDNIGRIYRSVLEPLCYVVGSVVLAIRSLKK